MTEHVPTQLRVLIANERRDRLEVLAQVVAGLGHDVIAREIDVRQVAAVTAREQPDVALVGLGESAEHALELISEIVHKASCPVIALLPSRDPDYVREAARRGVFAYIVDSTPEELQSAIDTTLQRFASWAGQCPGNDRSAGRRRSGRTRKGSKWLDWTLEEAALAAIRSKDAYLAAQYARLKPRRGHKKALGAVKHSIICACWHMLSTGELYRDLGGDYFQRRDPERTTKRLVRQLEALGHTVTLQPMAA